MAISDSILLSQKHQEGLMKLSEKLARLGIKSVWHFTDLDNLDSILSYGLLSLKTLKTMNIKSRFGASESSHILDEYLGLDRFVHLAFVKDHPMYHVAKKRGSLRNPIWLELDVNVVNFTNVKISDRIASASDAKIYNAEEIGDIGSLIDFEGMSSNCFDRRKEARKAEIMVPNIIQVKFIKDIYYGN